ncbi:MAG TPA: hypothetical protein VLE45_12085, partial [Burkholderiaceae bacterium]|nr:hypothetical protein [Burkholderiaceae bacterium]
AGVSSVIPSGRDGRCCATLAGGMFRRCTPSHAAAPAHPARSKLRGGRFSMAKPVQWLARLLGLNGSRDDDDDVGSFEHVDGSRLSDGELHLSDSMRLDDANVPDFAETLPSFSRRTVIAARAAGRGIAG